MRPYKIMFVGGYHPGQMLGTLFRACERLGHDVLHVPCMGETEQPEGLMALIDSFQPEIIWGFIPYTWRKPESFRAIVMSSATLVYWDFDFPQAAVLNPGAVDRAVPYFDVFVSTDDSEIACKYADLYGLPRVWLPPVYDAQQPLCPAPKTDLLFMGHGYANGMFQKQPLARTQRTAMAATLRESLGRTRLTICGDDSCNWPEDWCLPHVQWDEHFDWFSRAKVNIGQFCLIAPGKSRHMNFRPVVCIGAGGFLIQEYHEGLEDCFVDGQEIVYWTTYKDLVEKCGYYLEHQDEAREIAERGRQRVLRDYNAETWMEQVLGEVIARTA